MRSRLITAVAAAAALSSAASVALTQSLGAQAATSPQPTPTQLQERTNALLADIDRRLTGTNKELVSVQKKLITSNTYAAKTYNGLFLTTTWLNGDVSKYGYLGRLQEGLLAMCHLQAAQAQNFDYCTDNVSGHRPNP